MNESEIIKPATLLKEDFVKGLSELCNNSGLPFFILEYILKDAYLELKSLAKRQYEADLIKYTKLIDDKSQSKEDK